MRFEVRGFGIDVVVIEPGLIMTRFGETAAGSIGEAAGAAADGDDPYATFNAAVAAQTEGAYKGPMARLGGGPKPSRRRSRGPSRPGGLASVTRSPPRRVWRWACGGSCPIAPGTPPCALNSPSRARKQAHRWR